MTGEFLTFSTPYGGAGGNPRVHKEKPNVNIVTIQPYTH